MAIYYYEDQNGKYSSHTDARRFSRVSGKEAYAYLKSAEGKTRRFMKSNDYEDGGDDVFVEIPAEYIRDYRQGERREQYVNDIREDAGFTEISLYAMQGDGNPDDLLSGEELIADESVDVVAEVMHKMELETLRKALLSLSESEYRLMLEQLKSKGYLAPDVFESQSLEINGQINEIKTKRIQSLSSALDLALEEFKTLQTRLIEIDEPLDSFDSKLFEEVIKGMTVNNRDEMTFRLIGDLTFTVRL